MGDSVQLIGAIGTDPEGDALIRELASENVDTSYVRRGREATGRACVFVEPDGESSIVITAGANAYVTGAFVAENAVPVRSARGVLAQHEIPTDALSTVAQLATGQLILNPAPAQPLDEDILSRVDVLIPNRHELSAMVDQDVTRADLVVRVVSL